MLTGKSTPPGHSLGWPFWEFVLSRGSVSPGTVSWGADGQTLGAFWEEGPWQLVWHLFCKQWSLWRAVLTQLLVFHVTWMVSKPRTPCIHQDLCMNLNCWFEEQKVVDTLGLKWICLAGDKRDEWASGAKDGEEGEGEDKMGGRADILTAGGTLTINGWHPEVQWASVKHEPELLTGHSNGDVADVGELLGSGACG